MQDLLAQNACKNGEGRQSAAANNVIKLDFTGRGGRI
jgi:hypothetical protein